MSIPRVIVTSLLLSLVVSSNTFARQGTPPPSASAKSSTLKALRYVPKQSFDAIDRQALLAEDAATPKGTPLRVAVPKSVDISAATDGVWEDVADGKIWRYRFSAERATGLRFTFGAYELPPGATLHLVSETYDFYEGPFTSDDQHASGQFHTPLIPGSAGRLEMFVPNGQAQPKLEVSTVHLGYRDFLNKEGNQNLSKADFCNNDVVCPEGDPWRDEIRSVGRYLFTNNQGTFTCTGTMMMDAERSFTPYFLTAFHCLSSASTANTVTVYWNFESPTCGALSGGNLTQNQTGSTLRATRQDVDMTLLELDADPDPSFNVYFAGWDASGVAPQGSVAIHHPRGDEKAISFNDDVLTTRSNCIFPQAQNTHWNVDDWEDGTTEPGSSGSGIWDPNSRQLVGFLSGGAASCSVIDFDCYGKFSVAWNGASGANLRDWLDPNNTGINNIDGSDVRNVSFTGKMASQDDGNNSGTPEVTALRIDNEVIKAQVSDASTGQVIRDLSFLNSDWTAQSVFGMPANNGGSPGTAVLATRNSDGLPIVQVKNPVDGSLVGNIFPWSGAWNILDTDYVPGAAAGGETALAILASRKSDGLMGVELKDPSNDSRIRLIYPLGFGWSAINLEVVDVNGSMAVATLATRDADGLAIVQVRDATTGALIRNVFPLGLGWSPIEVKRTPDLNGNGVDEVAVRMTRDSDGLEVIQIRDAQTNALVNNVYPIGAGAGGWSTQQFEVVDINGVIHLGILSTADSNGQILVQTKNALTSAIDRNTFFIGPPYVYLDFFVLPDFNGSNTSELAVLVQNTNTDVHIIQVRDSNNGNVIRNVFQP